MPKINLTPSVDYGAERLNKISRKIVSLAFRMGGSQIDYYRAIRCNYQFPDGRTCWNKVRQTPSVDCPVCAGQGAYYIGPIKIPAIFIDSRDRVIRDKIGLKFTDNARLVVPPSIGPAILKHVDGGKNLQILRDKFVIRDHTGKIDSVFYIDSEPKNVWLAGTLYYSFGIVINRANESDSDPIFKEYEPRLFYTDPPKSTEELLNAINEDVLSMRNINGITSEDGTSTSGNEVVLDGETGDFIPLDDLEDEWA